jgi:chemotaxis signal transduction protein
VINKKGIVMARELKPAVRAEITRQQSLLYLALILGDEIFGWQGLDVRDVVDGSAMIQLPDMPAFICGGLSWRGKAVPVVDLEARLSRRSTPITKSSKIVVIELAQGGVRQLLGVVMNPLARSHRAPSAVANVCKTLGIALDPSPAATEALPSYASCGPRPGQMAVAV